MRHFARQILIAALFAGLLGMPAFAAASNTKPLGLVIQADSALLDNSAAAMGTSVFSGDALETQPGGSLRLRIGSSQLYLLSSSAATLAQGDPLTQAQVLRGTVGFSTIAPDQIEMQTPLGILRADKGQAVYGQVRVVGPQEMIVTAYRGDLSLEYDGDSHTLKAGKSYDVTMESDNSSSASPAAGNASIVSPKNRHIAIKVLIIAAEAITAYLLWQEFSESCYNFKGC